MSELWTVTLRFRGAQAPPVSLFFGGEAAARKEFSKFTASGLGFGVIEDHYGTSIVAFGAGIPLEAAILQDVAKALDAQVEMALKQAISQARAQRRVAGDPELKFMTGQNVGVPGMGMIRG
jgi:hypothetical protein